jgi:hypothetical protein
MGHNFDRGPHRDHPCQVWFNLVQRPLPKLCPGIPTSNQDGHQAKNRKKRDEILTAATWQEVV